MYTINQYTFVHVLKKQLEEYMKYKKYTLKMM